MKQWQSFDKGDEADLEPWILGMTAPEVDRAATNKLISKASTYVCAYLYVYGLQKVHFGCICTYIFWSWVCQFTVPLVHVDCDLTSFNASN